MTDLFKAPLYLLFGKRPVKSERDAAGNLKIYAYYRQEGIFKLNMNYLERMYTRRDDEEDNITELTKEVFEDYVATLQAELSWPIKSWRQWK